MTGIFISYRRDDTAPYAGRLADRLTREFAEDKVFMDVDNIEPGDDFVEVIDGKLRSCQVVLVLIGPNWLGRKPDGSRRIDHPDDFVRLELARALAQRVRVIPVLVAEAQLPPSTELPDELKSLARRQAVELSDVRFHADAARLIERIRKDLGIPAAAGGVAAVTTAHEPAPDGPGQAAGAGEGQGGATPATGTTPGSARRPGWTLVSAATVVVAAISAALWFGLGTRPPETVVVPNVVGQTPQAAAEVLRAAGLELESVRDVPTDSAPPDTITEQHPTAGTQVGRGGAVGVVVARRAAIEAPPMEGVEVPRLVGLRFGEARNRLDRLGLAIVDVERRPDSEVLNWRIVSQTPDAGERLVKGSGVVQVVVAGLVLAKSRVPALSGLTQAAAVAALEREGLKLGKVGRREVSYGPWATVVDQRPSAGVSVDPESTVDVVVAVKPVGAPAARMPDFVGTAYSKAREWLRSGSYRNAKTSTTYKSDEVPPGVVTRQSPAAGEPVTPETAVAIEYSVWNRWRELPGRVASAAAAQERANADCRPGCADAGGKWTGNSELVKGAVRCNCDFYRPPTAAVTIR